jgi:hypothetical protein
MESENHKRNPLEKALDLFVYAPLGLLLNADEVVPQLIEKGKQQVATARVFGKVAVDKGQTRATKAIAKVQEQANEVVDQLSNNRRPDPDTPIPAPSTKAAPATPTPAPAVATTGPRAIGPTSLDPSTAGAKANGPKPTGPAAATLAIPDYDSLSASQVVPRLDGLSAQELDAVRRYELANRGRKTILNKIAQLPG